MEPTPNANRVWCKTSAGSFRICSAPTLHSEKRFKPNETAIMPAPTKNTECSAAKKPVRAPSSKFVNICVIYVLIVSPWPAVPSTFMPLPSRSTSAGPPQSFSTPHCSHVPPCLRPRREQDPIVFVLMGALLVVMYDILLQRSPQQRFSKQDQPRQTFFFDRPHPAFRVRVQIRASCWQSKRIHVSRLISS